MRKGQENSEKCSVISRSAQKTWLLNMLNSPQGGIFLGFFSTYSSGSAPSSHWTLLQGIYLLWNTTSLTYLLLFSEFYWSPSFLSSSYLKNVVVRVKNRKKSRIKTSQIECSAFFLSFSSHDLLSTCRNDDRSCQEFCAAILGMMTLVSYTLSPFLIYLSTQYDLN